MLPAYEFAVQQQRLVIDDEFDRFAGTERLDGFERPVHRLGRVEAAQVEASCHGVPPEAEGVNTTSQSPPPISGTSSALSGAG